MVYDYIIKVINVTDDKNVTEYPMVLIPEGLGIIT